MSEEKEKTNPELNIDVPTEITPEIILTTPSETITTSNLNEQKEDDIIINNSEIPPIVEDSNQQEQQQQPDLNDSSSLDDESNIRNKELKSLMQLTKEANLNISVPDKLETKRLMRSQFVETGVKLKLKEGQGPNTLDKDEKVVEGGGGKKRKRDSSSDSLIGGAIDGQNKELLKSAMELVEKNKDGFCWKCHRDGVTISCTTCPRSYHTKCLKNVATTTHWICPECTSILTAENTKTRSPALKDMPLGHLCKLLKFALKRMVQINDSEPFVSPVNETEFPDYRNYIVQPMDFTMLEKNIKANSYGSTKAFEADAKWLLHNSIVFNSSQSKLTTVAKSILKICKQEMIEIENCSTCYLNANTKKSWFIEVCPKPHLLVWAKLKGFPYWPAKVMCTNTQGSVDVRFFGAHDRAWVLVKDCFLYSVKDPNATQYKRDEINECVKEVEMYINNLKNIYGKFNYPPYKTPYNPERNSEQLAMFLPSYKNETKSEETEEIISPNKSLQSDEEEWEVKKYIEEGRSIKSPSPEEITPKRGPKKPLKTYSSEDMSISSKKSRRSSLQSNSSRVSSISDKTTKMEIECEDEKTEEKKKEVGKIRISDKLIKKFAPEIDKTQTPPKKDNEKESCTPKEIILGNNQNDLVEIEKEKISPTKTKKEIKLNSLQFKIKATHIKKPKRTYLKVSKPKYKIEMVHLKQDTSFDDDNEEEEDSLLEEMYSVEENQVGKPTQMKSRIINGTPKRKRESNISEFSSPIESKLLKLVDVDLIKNPKLHPLGIPGNTVTPIIKDVKDGEKDNEKEKIEEEIQIKTEIESEDDDYDSRDMFSLGNFNDKKVIEKGSENINKKGSENVIKKGSENFIKKAIENVNKKVNENVNKKGTENVNKKTENVNKKGNENITEKVPKGSEKVGEKVLKPTSLLKNPLHAQKTPQTSLLKTKQIQKNVEITPPTLNNTSKITTTPGIDSGGMMILAQPKQFLNNQLVLPPNQSITYGGNSISFVQHPQFQNYLIPTSAINVGAISLPVSTKPAGDSNPLKEAGNSNTSLTTSITTLSTSSSSTTSLITTTTPTLIISKAITTSLNPTKSNQVNNKSSPVTISAKPLPPLCRPQVSLSSQITLTAISNPTSTNSVSGSVPPPLCSLTTTTANLATNQVVVSSSINSSTSTQNNGAVVHNDGEDFSYLSDYVPEKLMKALTEATSRPPPPLLTPKPTNNISGICQRVANSTGPIAMKINSATHKLTDYFRETLLKFLSEFGTTTNDSPSNSEAEIALLKLELENAKQQHNLEILEMKQNLQTILKEVHRNFSEERRRVVEETRRSCELDAQKRIEEAKSKQWCSVCGKEAQFYCCWNTSYCDYPCQIKHWPTHMEKCTQSNNKTDATTTVGNGKQSGVIGKKGGVLTKVSAENNLPSASKSTKVYSSPKTTVQNKNSNSTKTITLQ